MRWPRSWWSWTSARRVTASVLLLCFLLSGLGVFPWLQGSMTSATWFDLVPLADPLAALEVMLASRAVQPTVLIGAGLLTGIAILMGPVFCGWICPLGLVLDLNDWWRRTVGRSLLKKHFQDRSGWLTPAWPRYVVLGLVLGLAAVTRLPLFQAFSPINIVVWSVVFAMGPGLIAIAVLLVVEYFSPRLWCRSLCPLGALYGLIGRGGLFRVRVIASDAGPARCQRCSRSCHMGIRVMEDYSLGDKQSIAHPDCMRCGACVDVCPGGILAMGFRNRQDVLPATGDLVEKPSTEKPVSSSTRFNV